MGRVKLSSPKLGLQDLQDLQRWVDIQDLLGEKTGARGIDFHIYWMESELHFKLRHVNASTLRLNTRLMKIETRSFNSDDDWRTTYFDSKKQKTLKIGSLLEELVKALRKLVEHEE